jgi:tRNA A37 N6-isopentenylltransferase MiaA
MATQKKLVSTVELSADQEALAERIYEKLKATAEQELMGMVRLMVSKPDHELFGRGEFELRDKLNELGAKVLETSANERVKKGLPR